MYELVIDMRVHLLATLVVCILREYLKSEN